MKIYLKFASIPLGLFALFFGLPKLFQVLFNSHSDAGLIAIVVLVCGIFSFVASKLYNNLLKENTRED